MRANIYQNVWASLVVWTKELRENLQDLYPNHPLQYIDWEAYHNVPELPEVDLIGPQSIAIIEHDEGLFSINFSVGISTHGTDPSLFRLRSYVSRIFNRMQSGQQIIFYDHPAGDEASVIQMVPGSHVSPMNDLTVRPYQYVQGSGLLIPMSQAA